MFGMDANQTIDFLGGTSAVAELCELTTGAVSQWRTNGIPKPWRKFLSSEVAKKARRETRREAHQ